MVNVDRRLLADEKCGINFRGLLTRDIKIDPLQNVRNGKVNDRTRLVMLVEWENWDEDLFRQLDLQSAAVALLLTTHNLTTKKLASPTQKWLQIVYRTSRPTQRQLINVCCNTEHKRETEITLQTFCTFSGRIAVVRRRIHKSVKYLKDWANINTVQLMIYILIRDERVFVKKLYKTLKVVVREKLYKLHSTFTGIVLVYIFEWYSKIWCKVK
jgi:hypothetical protein